MRQPSRLPVISKICWRWNTLTLLASFDDRRCRVLEMRVFGGMTPAQTAEALGVPEPSVRRELRLATAWLRQEHGAKQMLFLTP
jgi:DNA-directed RNA polymerase specialized sigma24 family protein